MCFLSLIDTSRKHHVDHAGFSNEISDTNGCPAPCKETALTLGQGKIGGRVHDPDMGRACKLKTAPDNRALQGCDHGHAAVFHLVESLMPPQTHMHEVSRTTIRVVMLDQIKTCAKMISGPRKDNRTYTCARRIREKPHQFFDRLQIERVAFLRPVQRDDPDAVLTGLDLQVPEAVGIYGQGHGRSGCWISVVSCFWRTSPRAQVAWYSSQGDSACFLPPECPEPAAPRLIPSGSR